MSDPGSPSQQLQKSLPKIVVATTVALSFISFWRGAAIVLSDLASTMFYVGGIAEHALGKSAPWFVLAVLLFGFAIRSIYLESCGMFVRGGVYVVVRDAIGPTTAKFSVSALVVDYVLTGPISSVSAGHYLAGLINELSAHLNSSFRLPPALEGAARSPLATALAAFGIIGVGATELIAYPYWCLEKGYARFTGPRSDSPVWAARANGWLRVMRWDAFVSMVIYTIATVAFYVLGAAVLHRQGLNPAGNQLVRTLAEMYVPVFGSWAQGLFLFGAFAVLYSTFFVASASHARVSADAVCVFGLVRSADGLRWGWVRAFCVIIPLFSLTVYYFIPDPTELIRWSGVMQAIMLPMLGGATLYFRYRRCDPRIAPGRVWDGLLWLSALGLLLAGGWTALTTLFPRLEQWP